jgi:hypothetical protein
MVTRIIWEGFTAAATNAHRAQPKTAKGNTMSIIGWLILGLIAGFIASKTINKTGEGPMLGRRAVCSSSLFVLKPDYRG